ncbi:hypothetical protein AAF143_04445 [Cyanobium sp. ATX-6F1]
MLRFDSATGLLQRAVELPEPWQSRPGQGLESNRGPEALTWLPGASGTATGDLLLAAEAHLRQDPLTGCGCCASRPRSRAPGRSSPCPRWRGQSSPVSGASPNCSPCPASGSCWGSGAATCPRMVGEPCWPSIPFPNHQRQRELIQPRTPQPLSP